MVSSTSVATMRTAARVAIGHSLSGRGGIGTGCHGGGLASTALAPSGILPDHRGPMTDTLKDRLSRNDELYGAQFAGHARATRDLALLDQMIAEADAVRQAADRGKQPAAVLDEANRQLRLYRGERAEIEAARAIGPTAENAARLATRANLVFHRYQRHFAGQSRSTRDPSLLVTMATELAAIASELQAVAAQIEVARRDLEVIGSWRTLLDSERKAIAQAREAGTLTQQAGTLGGAANHLFAQWKSLTHGQVRATRRPETLHRLVTALRDVEDRMQALVAQGHADADHGGNLQLVRQRIAAWDQELQAVQAERQKLTASKLVTELAAAADAERESWGKFFAGQNRKTRDLQRLTAMLDRLDDIERQLARLHVLRPEPAALTAWGKCLDTMTLWTGEWDQIRQAQPA
jgi:hypothetical protein